MGRDRFKDIHRFFSPNSAPSPLNAPWFHRIQRVADIIRNACRNAYAPSSNIAIDEAMVAFKGRSKHTVKLKSKPIDRLQAMVYWGSWLYLELTILFTKRRR